MDEYRRWLLQEKDSWHFLSRPYCRDAKQGQTTRRQTRAKEWCRLVDEYPGTKGLPLPERHANAARSVGRC